MLVQLTPLYHGRRPDPRPHDRRRGPDAPGPRRLPRGDGRRRPGDHLAPARQAAAQVGAAGGRRAILPSMGEPPPATTTGPDEVAGRVTDAPAPVDPVPDGLASSRAIGIDVGGTGVKAAVVDLGTGEMVSPRIREKTPQPATPEAVIEAIGSIVDRLGEGGHLDPAMPAGAGLPGVVKHGRLLTAANIDKRWVDFPAQDALEERLGRRVRLDQRRRRRRPRRGRLRGREGRARDGDAPDDRNRDRERPPRRRHGSSIRPSSDTCRTGAGMPRPGSPAPPRERRAIGWRRWAGEFSDVPGPARAMVLARPHHPRAAASARSTPGTGSGSSRGRRS